MRTDLTIGQLDPTLSFCTEHKLCVAGPDCASYKINSTFINIIACPIHEIGQLFFKCLFLGDYYPVSPSYQKYSDTKLGGFCLGVLSLVSNSSFF